MSTVDPVFLLFTTCPDAATATRLAHALVEERLAACVTRLDGAHSTYRWHGEISEDHEVQLLIKTTGSRLDAAAADVPPRNPVLELAKEPDCPAIPEL